MNKEELNHKMRDFKKRISKSIELNFYEKFLLPIRKNHDNKLILFRLAIDKSMKYMDFIKIAQTLQQFDKLKKIIFNTTQQNLFENHEKPVFDSKSLSESAVIEKEDDYQIYENYKKGKAKKDRNRVYKKLILNFDSNLKRIFDGMK